LISLMPSASSALPLSATTGRVVLENIGHFPRREAPDLVADIALEHLPKDSKPGS
jgi:hypothetical protein